MFKAQITFGSVSSGTTSKGVAFKKSAGTIVLKGQPQARTIMAFGAQLDSVKNLVRKGRTVDLMVAIERGTVKIIGPVRERAPAAAEG